MDKITFIHTADLHLDSPFKGLRHLPEELFQRVQNSTFASLERIVDKAIEMNVDFLLVSGDLYEEEDRSIKAQSRLKKQFERLQENGIAVYIIHGNHDYLGNQGMYLEMPANVKVFGKQVEKVVCVTNRGAEVHLYGFSYDARHVLERRISDYPKAPADGHFHIGLLHGSIAGETSVHEPYAPFTVNELKEKNYHYWALGHIHERQELSAHPPVVYPGNIQGRHRKEKGPKGCYSVTLTKTGEEKKFIETQEILWKQISVSLKEFSHLSQVYDLCRAEIESCRKEGGTFLEILFTDVKGTGVDIQSIINNGELLEAFQDGEEHQRDFVWVHSLKMEQKTRLDFLEGQETFLHDLIHTVENFDEMSWDTASAELFLHPQAHRYINSLKDDEKQEVKQSVLSMLEASFLDKEN